MSANIQHVLISITIQAYQRDKYLSISCEWEQLVIPMSIHLYTSITIFSDLQVSKSYKSTTKNYKNN